MPGLYEVQTNHHSLNGCEEERGPRRHKFKRESEGHKHAAQKKSHSFVLPSFKTLASYNYRVKKKVYSHWTIRVISVRERKAGKGDKQGFE